MATHKKTIKVIDAFLKFNKEYREKKLKNKSTLKDEAQWLELYKETSKVINEYDINKINYSKGKNV
jgi:hypothetical protein